MFKKIEEPILFYPYPTACGYRCFDGTKWQDCNKNGKPKEAEEGET